MDMSAIMFVSYRWHRISNPYSLDQLERTLAFTDLAPGDAAADLGCGNGYASAWMAERHGLDLIAVEHAPAVADLARQAAAQPRSQGRVEVVTGSAHDYLAGAGRHRLLSLLGPSDIFPGLERPADVMAALLPSIEPGGWLLWGDLFWKAPPGPQVTAVYSAERYASLTGWVAAGEAAGLTPRYVAVSADADWEEFVWRMNASLEDGAASAPAAEAPVLRQRAAAVRRLYLEVGREGVGFGLYLFQRPLG